MLYDNLYDNFDIKKPEDDSFKNDLRVRPYSKDRFQWSCVLRSERLEINFPRLFLPEIIQVMTELC